MQDLVRTPVPAALLAWLLTYLLHSTLLLCMAWLIARRLPDALSPLRERVWKAALLGGLLTATLQVGLGIEPYGGRWALRTAITSAASSQPVGPSSAGLRERAGSDEEAAPWDTSEIRDPSGAWGPTLLTVWLAGALVGTAWLLVGYLRLLVRLRGRREMRAGPFVELLRELSRASRRAPHPRLTAARRISVPMALGLGRGEICLPSRSLNKMDPARREAVLAHEMAHLENGDPLWFWLISAVENLLFLQPLNRLAGAHLRRLAEYRCDDWAVERTGDPLTLVRCLLDIACSGGALSPPVPGPQLAEGRSDFARRVGRLLEAGPLRRRTNMRAWHGATMALALGLVLFMAPGFAGGAVTATASGGAEESNSHRASPGDTSARVPDPPAKPPEAVSAKEPTDGDGRVAPSSPERKETETREELEARLEAKAKQLLERQKLTQEKMAQLEETARELAVRAERMAERRALSEADLEKLHREASRIAASAHLSEKEVQELAERARKLARATKPSEEEIRKLREEARRIAEAAKPSEEDLREIREAAAKLRKLAEEERRKGVE